jgi:hypothetical protein
VLIELGNHRPLHPGPDDRPKVTYVNIPEFDAEFHEKTGDLYGHKPGGIKAKDFKDHYLNAMLYNQGITQLPGHEALLSTVAAWGTRGQGPPEWVKVTPHESLTPKGKAEDLERVLAEYYGVGTLEQHYNGCSTEEAHVRKELEYWTRAGAPGEFYGDVPKLPDAKAVYTVDGRIMNNNNDGGDTLLVAANGIGTGSAATATTLTTSSTLVGTTALPGHRIYVYTTSGSAFVWGNIISNTAGAGGVITVDRWYNVTTPGGTAGTTPGTPWAWVVQDGGMTSSWFAALATGANGLTNTDHTLATSGNVEYTQAGGTLIREICPTATDVSASARTVTLVPVFTANASDVGNLPKIFTVVGFFTSMVPGFGGAGGPMKLETVLTPSSATISALNDQLTVTSVLSGS